MKWLGISAAVLVNVFGFQYAIAADPSLELKVLPLDCVFETVNDGSSVLRYLTPEDCGQIVSVPSVGQPIPDGSNPSSITTINPYFSRPGDVINPSGAVYLDTVDDSVDSPNVAVVVPIQRHALSKTENMLYSVLAAGLIVAVVFALNTYGKHVRLPRK